MASLLHKKDKPPTPQDLARIEGNENVRTQEIVNADVDFGSLVKAKELAPLILDDGLIEKYFSPYMSVPSQDGESEVIVENPLYSPAYEPLRPFCTRKLPLGNMTESEIGVFKSDVHAAVQNARTFAISRLEHCLIDSLEQYIDWTVTIHARGGNTIKALTETRVYKSLLTPPVEKKRGFFGF